MSSPWVARGGRLAAVDAPALVRRPPSTSSFVKSAAFAPDGSTLLCTTEDGSLLLLPVDSQLVQEQGFYDGMPAPPPSAVPDAVEIKAGEAVHDVAWRPSNADSQRLFVATMRDHPIHLYDATTGAIIETFVARNDLDEPESATVLSFNLQGTHVYAASKHHIAVFDLEQPGACPVARFSTAKSGGRRPIVSALAFCPDYSGAYAAGTYSHSVSVYVESSGATPVLELPKLGSAVTCLRWSPDGVNLWVGGRGNDDLICWDMRHTRSELGRVQRQCQTQQRYSFALDPWGELLCTGSGSGDVLVYDTATFKLVWRESAQGASMASNAVAMHPYSALLAVAHGHRHFPESDDDSEGEGECGGQRRGKKEEVEAVSSVQLWRLPFSRLSRF